MKRRELNKTFMIEKNPLVSMVYTKIFQSSKLRVKSCINAGIALVTFLQVTRLQDGVWQ